MISKKIIFTLFLLSSVTAYSQAELKDSIDSFISKTLKNIPEIPGLSITVVKEGAPFFTKSYGYADVSSQIKTTNNSPFYIASATKSFVGLLAVLMEEEGILDLDKSITSYAPIKYFEDNSIFKDVTIKDLLSHTSGIKNGPLTWKYASIGEYTKKNMITILKDRTVSRGNNKSFRYDNFGYNVLDIILSEEFGINWKDALQEKVFTPLRMTHTSAYLSDAERKKWNIAKNYIAINDERIPKLATTQKNDATFQAAGGMIVSIEDAQNWLLVNLNKGRFKGKQVFSNKALSKTHDRIVKGRVLRDIFKDSGYGIGWINASFKGKKVIYHYGGFDGAFSHISFFPQEKIGIAIFTNESHFGDNVSSLIAEYVYDLLLNDKNSLKSYSEKAKKLVDRVSRIQKIYKEDRKARSNRKWKLSQPINSYEGTYKNQHIGTLKVGIKKEKPIVSFGITNAIATPSNNDDSFRVEFRSGRGEDVLFVIDQSGRIIAAVYQGWVFLKSE